jgi:multisubunit Na+/H+ antiporter MnhF subunit
MQKTNATSARMWKFELQVMPLDNLSSLMLLSILRRKAIAAMDRCIIGPTVEDNIIRKDLQGVQILAIHANY